MCVARNLFIFLPPLGLTKCLSPLPENTLLKWLVPIKGSVSLIFIAVNFFYTISNNLLQSHKENYFSLQILSPYNIFTTSGFSRYENSSPLNTSKIVKKGAYILIKELYKDM